MTASTGRWERPGEWPLTAAAIAFLVAYAWPILDPELAPTWVGACRVVSIATWLVFVGYYLVRLALARDRRHFMGRNLLDLAVVVLPLLRPLRLLVLVRALGVLNRAAGASLRGRVATYVAEVDGAGAVRRVPRDPGRRAGRPGRPHHNLRRSRVVVVRDRDHGGVRRPATRSPATGRARRGGVSCSAGIALLGVVTASFASWLIDRVAATEEESETATRRDVHRLTDEVGALRAEIAALRERR